MKRDTVITCLEPNRRARTMTTVLDGHYKEIDPYSDIELGATDDDHEETPHESGIIIDVVPEDRKARWNHIEDLDSFFRRMYHYHQNHGFVCMMLQQVFELVQFIFVVGFSIFLFYCVDYSILFKDKIIDPTKTKVTMGDVIYSQEEILASMGLWTWICIIVASLFWTFRLIKVLYHMTQFWDIKMFFNHALKIDDINLDNLTWHDVQKKVMEVQKEQQMCIHKRELTELDIYHRILRFKNYMVAMVNKSLLSIHLKLPILGDIIFMTRGLKYNIELILFWGPWSPFENNWHLKEDYKKLNKRQELARSLSKYILWVGIANFILCPVILLWQLLYSAFTYGELVKREPGALGARMWSLYGRLYLRHFNELDHELKARLNRAYRPAARYMSIFTSPVMAVLAKNVAFISGSMLGVLLGLTMYDEDVITVEHVLTAISGFGISLAIAATFIPDENLVWCPETLLTAVLAHTHYRPDSWKGYAHTHSTRAQVDQLFQYRAVYVLEELLSPLVTPFILCFHMRPRALEIVDFYRNFTIEVTGVGDVCSFAQMDVRRHGNPMWQTLTVIPPENKTDYSDNNYGGITSMMGPTQYTQTEDGKTELSLIHFTLTNPEWSPPNHAEQFVSALKERAKKEVNVLPGETPNPLMSSLTSLSSLGPGYNDIVNNIFRGSVVNNLSTQGISQMFGEPSTSNNENFVGIARETGNDTLIARTRDKAVKNFISKTEGPLRCERGLLHDLQQGFSNQSLGASIFGSGLGFTDPSNSIEFTAADMSLSTLYLHELHQQQVKRRGFQASATRSVWQHDRIRELESLPEIKQECVPLLRHKDSSIRMPRNS